MERADFEVLLTDGSHEFISWSTRNLYDEHELIIAERCIESFEWEDNCEVIETLNKWRDK